MGRSLNTIGPAYVRVPSIDGGTIRQLERQSIREFVASCADELTGRVLDFGCGKQPYRPLVEAVGGEYVGYDRAVLPANVSGEDIGPGRPLALDWDAILCTQVLQYVESPETLLLAFGDALQAREGVLVLTYPTTWPEVEPDDLHRFTKNGMERLLEEAGFDVLRHERRATLNMPGFELAVGYGVLARVR